MTTTLKFPANIDFSQNAENLFDINLYNSVIDTIITNWVDSPSKSLLHCFENIDFGNLPEAGTSLLTNNKTHTQMCVLLGWGVSNTQGLKIISSSDIIDVNTGRSLFGQRVKSDMNLEIKTEVYAPVETVLQMILHYIFQQKEKSKNTKLPKYLYRGVRMSSLKNKMESYDNRFENSFKRLKSASIFDGCDGNFQSFTESEAVAKMFSISQYGDGFVIRIELNEDMIISSYKTEPCLDIINEYHYKHEKEFIIDAKKVKSFEIVDITDWDSGVGSNKIEFAKNVTHDCYRVVANFKKGDVEFEIEFSGYWHSNTKFVRTMYLNSCNVETDLGYSSKEKDFKKVFGNDYLNFCTGYVVYDRKNLIYTSK